MAYPKLDCKSALWPKYSLTAIRGAMIGQLIFEADGGFMRQKLIMRQTSKQPNNQTTKQPNNGFALKVTLAHKLGGLPQKSE